MKKRSWRTILLSSKENHDLECNHLRSINFDSLKNKNEMLRYYCEEVFTRDIQLSIFLVLDVNEYRFPTIERSIERGKKYYWIHDEFIVTDFGLLPRWYVENKSVYSY